MTTLRVTVIGLFALAILSSGIHFSHAEGGGEPARQKFEYWAYRGGNEKEQLDALGSEGWELVAVEAGNVRGQERIMYFKRRAE